MADKKLEWGIQAVESLCMVLSRIRQDNVQAAEDLYTDIRKRLRLTLTFPLMYRASTRMEGVREIVVTSNYIVPYRVTATAIDVLDIVHARRNWPNAPASTQ